MPGFVWLRELDSNKHRQIQNLESYPLNDLAVALAPGIEPRLADSKSAVLPLDEARMLVPGPRVERDSMAFQTIATTALAHRGITFQVRRSNKCTPCSLTIPAEEL